MRDKTWEVQHGGRLIRVVNCLSVFPPSTSERVEVDGSVVTVSRNAPPLAGFCVLKADVEFSGAVKPVEARLARKARSLAVGCHILIDGQLVGGDTEAQLALFDQEAAFARAKALVDRGALRYIATRLLWNGLPYALAMAVIQRQANLRVGVIVFVVHLVGFGGAMGWWTWRMLKRGVDQGAP